MRQGGDIRDDDCSSYDEETITVEDETTFYDDETITLDVESIREDRNLLHELIEVKRWEEVLLALEQPGGKEMARTPFHNRRGEFPLHVVCDFVDPMEGGGQDGDDVGSPVFVPPPPKLVKALIEAYPDAAKTRGQKGCLPLHLAVERRLSVEIIALIIQAYPPALDMQDGAQKTPRDYVKDDPQLSVMLDRPTCCWVEQIKDDEIQETMATELKDLQIEMEKLSKEVNISLEEDKEMASRFEKIDQAVSEMSGLPFGKEVEERTSTMESEISVEAVEVDKKLSFLKDLLEKQNRTSREESAYMKDFNDDLIKLYEELDLFMGDFKKEFHDMREEMKVHYPQMLTT